MNGKRILMLAICALLSGSCSKVVFEADPNAGNPGGNGTGTGGPGTTTLPDITCSTYFNNHASSVAVNSAAQNPSVHADCVPANVTLSWTVRNSSNAAVTINGLQGASSAAADFYGAGTGTYRVTVLATAPGYNDLTTAPITATVANTTTPPATTPITCVVTANGATAPVTVGSTAANPHIVATCNPSAGSYVWTVTQGGGTKTIPGLTGNDSTPDFYSTGPGTYLVYLQVTQLGYLPYNTTTPLQITVNVPVTHAVTTTKTVTASNNQLDILFVVDNSNSMLADNQRLAGRLQGFVNNLTTAGFDWQMCATVTMPQQITTSDPNLYWGASDYWVGNPTTPSYILKSGTANLNTIFMNTITQIGAGWAGSDDERGIKAAWWSLYNGDINYTGNSGCYRKDAGLAMIFISDEDERSVGGDPTQVFYTGEYKPLENDDLPANLITKVKAVFGNSKRFVANSVIVRPGDTACMAAQDAEGSKSHFGTKYAELSQLTGGYVESICNTDFSQGLEYFKNSIVTQMSSLTLDCTPIGTPTVTVTPAMTYNYSLNGASLVFSPAIPAGRTITVQYTCPN